MEKDFYFDVTYLRHARDLRGIPQVILQLAGLFAEDARFARVRFIVTPGLYEKFLAPLGIGRERVREVASVPWLGRSETFHGLFSTFRYRNLIPEAALIVHPEFRTVVRARVPQIVLYYDFIIFEAPPIRGRGGWLRRLYFQYKNLVAARVPRKIAISAYTKKRASEIFPSVRAETVIVLPLGVRGGLSENAGVRNFPPYTIRFLTVGAFDVRKNIPALLEHFREIAGGVPCELHMAGWLDDGKRREVEERIRVLGISESIRLHGLVSDQALQALYAESDFLLFPSLFEGFGLPVIEAMAHGMVVCAFENSSISEVGGESIILRPNGDFAGWGNRIREMIANQALYREMSRKAMDRAKEFSETAMRKRYADYFLEAMSRHRP